MTAEPTAYRQRLEQYPEMIGEPLCYTPLEAAQLLGMSRNQIYIAINDGDIPAKRVGGKILIPRGRLHAWLDAA